MLGRLDGGRVLLEEVHRFANRSRTDGAHLRWDLALLEREIDAGIEKAAARGEPIAGISTDSWGIDYVLLDAAGRVLADPHCYRDPRTHEATARLFARLPFADIYRETGIQFMTINTIYHFEAQQHADLSVLAGADHFLTIADYFNARLSGVAAVEQSLASTTQLYDPRTHAWSEKLVAALEVKPSLFPRSCPAARCSDPSWSGSKNFPRWRRRRSSRPARTTPAPPLPRCLPLARTGPISAPARGRCSARNFPHRSSATPRARPALPTRSAWAARSASLKTSPACGCCRNAAARGKPRPRSTPTRSSRGSPRRTAPAAAHISLDDPRFLAPPATCRRRLPRSAARRRSPCRRSRANSRARFWKASRSLTRRTLRELEAVTGRTFHRLHIVGGGSRSALLNQLAADATGRTVIAGPVEATAVGNILIQALALGHLASRDDLRRIVAASFPTQTFTPSSS